MANKQTAVQASPPRRENGWIEPGIPEILTQDQHLGETFIQSTHSPLLAYPGRVPLAVVLVPLMLLSLSVDDDDQLGRSDFITT